MDMMASGRNSPAQIIQRSDDIKSAFNLILEASDPTSTIKNLRAAKHRFESYQKPLGRTIRLFRPIHALMVQLAIRGGDVAPRAKEWLDFICDSPQPLVMAAMLADAADEAMGFTRFCDSEAMEVALLASEISTFMDRVTSLFGPRRYCLQCPCYTSAILAILQDPLVWVIGTKQQSLRPPTNAEVDACFKHMQSWLLLAKEEINAEFPDWEIAQAFMVFDLSHPVCGDTLCQDPIFQKNVRRLALACGTDAVCLQSEFVFHQHHARQLRLQRQCDSKTAWTLALQRHDQKRKEYAQAHPDRNIRKVLFRWLAFTASTSGSFKHLKHVYNLSEAGYGVAASFTSSRWAGPAGVEQSFTKILMSVKPQTLHTAGPAYFCAHCKLAADVPKLTHAQEVHLATHAQRIWIKIGGPCENYFRIKQILKYFYFFKYF